MNFGKSRISKGAPSKLFLHSRAKSVGDSGSLYTEKMLKKISYTSEGKGYSQFFSKLRGSGDGGGESRERKDKDKPRFTKVFYKFMRHGVVMKDEGKNMGRRGNMAM